MKNQIILAILILTFAIFGGLFLFIKKKVFKRFKTQEMEKVSQPSEEVFS